MIFTIFPEFFYEKWAGNTESRARRRLRNLEWRQYGDILVTWLNRAAYEQQRFWISFGFWGATWGRLEASWGPLRRPRNGWITRDSVTAGSLEIPESSSHSRFQFPAENRFFYRKTGNFHRKNDQEKISEIFVHLAPENTRLNQVSEKVARKIHFNLFPAVSEAN